MKKTFIFGLVLFLTGSVAVAVLSQFVKKDDFQKAKNYFNSKGTSLNVKDAVDYNFDEKFSFKDASELNVDLIFGDVKMTESKDNQLHVILKSKVGKDSVPPDTKKIIFQDGSRVNIDFTQLYNDQNPSQTWMEITDNSINISEAFSLRIEIPKQYRNVKLTTISADTQIRDLKLQRLDLHNVSGDYDLKQIDSAMLTLDNVSGDIEFDQVSAREVKLNTVSGDLEFAELNFDQMNVDTVSGDIQFKYAKPSDLLVKMDSVSGSIEGDEYFKKYITDNTLKLGDPKKKITINSVSGDIEFTK